MSALHLNTFLRTLPKNRLHDLYSLTWVFLTVTFMPGKQGALRARRRDSSFVANLFSVGCGTPSNNST